jgi:DNA phosphorothioation-dependent restriction protein DptG
MNVGTAIKKIRCEKNFSQGELASKSGIAQTTISQIEQDNRKPSSKNLKKICKALNIPEELIYLYAFESVVVPEKNKMLFKKMFPPFKEMMKYMIIDNHD